MAVRVLERHLAVPIIQCIPGEAASAGSICHIASFAEGVEGLALAHALMVEIPCVAGSASALLVEGPAEGVLLFGLDDATGAADHIAWEAAGAGSR